MGVMVEGLVVRRLVVGSSGGEWWLRFKTGKGGKGEVGEVGGERRMRRKKRIVQGGYRGLSWLGWWMGVFVFLCDILLGESVIMCCFGGEMEERIEGGDCSDLKRGPLL